MAGRLARERAPAGVYASPLRRAVQTAEIIARACVSEVVIVGELRELNDGALDGRSDQQARAIHDWVLADWQAGRRDSLTPPHGVPAVDTAGSTSPGRGTGLGRCRVTGHEIR